MQTTPLDLIFLTISNMTSGLISDMTTLIVAMLVIAFIVFGFEMLCDALKSHIGEKISERSREDANKFYRMSELMKADKPSYDYYRAKYLNSINRASKY